MKEVLMVIFLTLSFFCNFCQADEMTAMKGDFDFKKMEYIVTDVTDVSRKDFFALKEDKNIVYSCEIDNVFIITCYKGRRPVFPTTVRSISEIIPDNNFSKPYVAVRRGIESPLDSFTPDRLHILYSKGPYCIFQASPETLEELSRNENNHFKIEKFDQNLRLRVNIRFAFSDEEGQAVTEKDEIIEEDREGIKKGNVKEIKVEADINRLSEYIKKFEDFKTRYTYTDSYRKAAQFALEEFKKMGYEAYFHEYQDGGRKQINVVAQKKAGADLHRSKSVTENGIYIVCAHLDSMSSQATTLAPGADDNASGAAGVLEIAALLSKSPHAERFRFVLFAGEEVGLKGSRAYVTYLKDSGQISSIKGAVNLDMIGFDRKGPLSALFETRSISDSFMKDFVEEARKMDMLVSISYNPWGSDHVSFLNAQIPCFLFIEDEFEDNPNYHKTTDRYEFLNMKLVAAITSITARVLLQKVSRP